MFSITSDKTPNTARMTREGLVRAWFAGVHLVYSQKPNQQEPGRPPAK